MAITLVELLNTLEAHRNRRLVKAAAEIFFFLARAILRRMPGHPRCSVCNSRLICIYRRVISEDLAADWQLDSEWRRFFDTREGEICIGCGASLRIRHLAQTMAEWLKTIGGTASTVEGAIQEGLLGSLRIAEINSCGALHGQLRQLSKLSYSEFLPTDSSIRHEDVLCLTYPDASFDLVLHSDTLEHTADVDCALKETYRVLASGGVSIFTVPMVRDKRMTLVRAEIRNGTPYFLTKPSYHGGSLQTTRQYLVFYEFGQDFVARVRNAGFDVDLKELDENPAVTTFVARKP